jgi:hypothetical protein
LMFPRHPLPHGVTSSGARIFPRGTRDRRAEIKVARRNSGCMNAGSMMASTILAVLQASVNLFQLFPRLLGLFVFLYELSETELDMTSL